MNTRGGAETTVERLKNKLLLDRTNMPHEPWRRVQLPRHSDARGALTFLEEGSGLPFPPRRIYFLYDVPPNTVRGEHAHKDLRQIIFAAAGSFTVVLDDGHKKERFHVEGAQHGLFVGPMTWRSLTNFTNGAVCAVVASAPYDENDYVRDYDVFLELAEQGS